MSFDNLLVKKKWLEHAKLSLSKLYHTLNLSNRKAINVILLYIS
jgi:hypothetical protein